MPEAGQQRDQPYAPERECDLADLTPVKPREPGSPCQAPSFTCERCYRGNYLPNRQMVRSARHERKVEFWKGGLSSKVNGVRSCTQGRQHNPVSIGYCMSCATAL